MSQRFPAQRLLLRAVRVRCSCLRVELLMQSLVKPVALQWLGRVLHFGELPASPALAARSRELGRPRESGVAAVSAVALVLSQVLPREQARSCVRVFAVVVMVVVVMVVVACCVAAVGARPRALRSSLVRVVADRGVGRLGREASSGYLVVVSVDDAVLVVLEVRGASPAVGFYGVQLLLVEVELRGMELLGLCAFDVLMSRAYGDVDLVADEQVLFGVAVLEDAEV